MEKNTNTVQCLLQSNVLPLTTAAKITGEINATFDIDALALEIG